MNKLTQLKHYRLLMKNDAIHEPDFNKVKAYLEALRDRIDALKCILDIRVLDKSELELDQEDTLELQDRLEVVFVLPYGLRDGTAAYVVGLLSDEYQMEPTSFDEGELVSNNAGDVASWVSTRPLFVQTLLKLAHEPLT